MNDHPTCAERPLADPALRALAQLVDTSCSVAFRLAEHVQPGQASDDFSRTCINDVSQAITAAKAVLPRFSSDAELRAMWTDAPYGQ